MSIPTGPTVLNAPEDLGRCWSFNWSRVEEGERKALLANLPDRVFDTSGTTRGRGVSWHRTGRQLAAEVEVTVGLLPSGIDAMFSTAPPTSLYGYVFTSLVPARLGVPVTFDRWGMHGSPLGGRHPLIAMIPPAWKRLEALLAAAPAERVTLVHAGAPLPARAFEVASRFSRPLRSLELFGATETGLIAWREAAPPLSDAPWTLVDDVTMLPSRPQDQLEGERPLGLRSPRVGRRRGRRRLAHHILGDLVKPLGSRQFIFAGRRERLCKPGGKLVDLYDLEDRVAALLPNVDAACLPVLHPELGEHVELCFVASSSGPTAEEVRRRLMLAQPPLPVVPARIVPVANIERSAMGKVRAIESERA